MGGRQKEKLLMASDGGLGPKMAGEYDTVSAYLMNRDRSASTDCELH